MRILKAISASLSIMLMVACGSILLLSHWSAFGWKALSVPTGSMRPSIPPGSLVLVHSVPDSTLKVGDVITYTDPLNLKVTLSHRIIKKYSIGSGVLGFVTKGDANKVADLPIAEGLVKGKVVWHVPDVGHWLMWSKTWLGISILVYLPALLIIIEEIARMNDYYKQLQPYRLIGYGGYQILKESRKWVPKAAVGLSTFAIIMFAAGLIGPRVEALLGSNTVSLGPNRLIVAASSSGGGGNKCSGNTNNNVNVNNSSTQTATSGNASVSGNTTGGSATSGSASNGNSTTVNITVTNCP